MNDRLQTAYRLPEAGAFTADRFRVLRNTYWLLALSLVPTVLGAWIGVATGAAAAMMHGAGAFIFLIGAFMLIGAIDRTRNSGTGVALLLLFTGVMGFSLAPLIGAVLGLGNGVQLVMTAFGGTAGIFFAMAALATFVKRDLGGLAKFLFVGLVIACIVSVLNLFFHSAAAMLALEAAVMVICSLFMLVDIKRIVDGGETNYIRATLAIYLDLFNVFQALLTLLGVFGGDRRN